jgi:hypothetical protein
VEKYAQTDWLFRSKSSWARVPAEDHNGIMLKFTDFSGSQCEITRPTDRGVSRFHKAYAELLNSEYVGMLGQSRDVVCGVALGSKLEDTLFLCTLQDLDGASNYLMMSGFQIDYDDPSKFFEDVAGVKNGDVLYVIGSPSIFVDANTGERILKLVPRSIKRAATKNMASASNSLCDKPGYRPVSKATKRAVLNETTLKAPQIGHVLGCIHDVQQFCWMIACCIDKGMLDRMEAERMHASCVDCGCAIAIPSYFDTQSTTSLLESCQILFNQFYWPSHISEIPVCPNEKLEAFISGANYDDLIEAIVLIEGCVIGLSAQSIAMPQLIPLALSLGIPSNELHRYNKDTLMVAIREKRGESAAAAMTPLPCSISETIKQQLQVFFFPLPFFDLNFSHRAISRKQKAGFIF